MERDQSPALAESIYAALFTGLITVGAYIAVPIPFSPVPIVLQNFFVLLAGLLLPARWAAASVALYLGLGAIGLPVFSAARGGLAHFAGPTGGYLVGFLPAAVACAAIAGSGAVGRRGTARDALAASVGTLIIYALGVPWLAQVMDLTPAAALSAGVFPFLPGDVIKIVAAVAVARAARPLARRLGAPGASG
jgi:biotin transport system substrate-specific component